MTERDLPAASGPLARLRAQLAGPRGFRRIDALLSSDDAAAAVGALSPTEVFELVHEVGFEDAQGLLELATPAQLQGCLDLDGWTKDELDLPSLRPWLAALVELGFEKLGAAWGGLDAELRALILQRSVVVYDTTLGEGPEDDNEAPMMATPDSFFVLELRGDDEAQRLTLRLVEDLYRADADLARHTIMAARSELASHLEEFSYRWRAGRLADQGYVDFYEALELFRPLEVDQVRLDERTAEPAGEDEPSRLPVAIAEEVLGRSFLARALGQIDDPAEATRLESALMVLVNKTLAAGRARPGQPEVVRRGALYATSTVSLGLEAVARGDVGRATEALRQVALARLFRVGYTLGVKLARLAQALAPRSLTAGAPAREVVSALCSPRPLLSRVLDQPPAAGVRPFESAADLRRAADVLGGLTLRIALAEGLGVDVLAMGQAPEPRAALDDHIRTALARALAGGAARGEALSAGELAALRARFVDGRLPADARAAGHEALVARVADAQLAASGQVLIALIDGWLDDLERTLGGIRDAEVDPRFVEGVLVERRRD